MQSVPIQWRRPLAPRAWTFFQLGPEFMFALTTLPACCLLRSASLVVFWLTREVRDSPRNVLPTPPPHPTHLQHAPCGPPQLQHSWFIADYLLYVLNIILRPIKYFWEESGAHATATSSGTRISVISIWLSLQQAISQHCRSSFHQPLDSYI